MVLQLDIAPDLQTVLLQEDTEFLQRSAEKYLRWRVREISNSLDRVSRHEPFLGKVLTTFALEKNPIA